MVSKGRVRGRTAGLLATNPAGHKGHPLPEEAVDLNYTLSI